MKRTELWNSITATLLAAVVALGGIGCLVTGFDMHLGDLAHVVSIIVFYALACGICCRLRWGLPALIVGSMAVIAAQLRWGELLDSLEKLLRHITVLYDQGYGWGYISWSGSAHPFVALDGALILLGCLVALTVCVTLSRRKGMALGLIAGILPLAFCCVLTDTVPDGVFLWVLLSALVMMVLTQRLRKISLRDANRVTALLLVPVMLLTGFLSSVEPEGGYRAPAQIMGDTFVEWANHISKLFPSGFVEVPGVTEPGGEVVITDSVDLQNAGPNNLGEHTVMRATAQAISGLLYLRGKSYDGYTGLAWNTSVDTRGEGGWPTSGLYAPTNIQIETVRSQPQRYFGYYPFEEDWTDNLKGGCLPNDDRLLSYTVRRSARKNTVTTVQYKELSQEEMEIYTALPEKTRESAQAILDDMGIQRNMSHSAIAALVQRYVLASANYDTNTGPMPDDAEDFALWFLEESASGYCVHFASATAVLLRAAGIPARYVTGYLTYVEPGKTCLVTAAQAHAWVEYLDPKLGWTVLDSTPGAPTEPILPPTEPTDPPATTEQTDPPETTEETDPPATTENTDPTETVTPTQSEGTTQPASTETVAETTAPGDDPPVEKPPIRLNLAWMKLLLWIALVWLAVAGQYKLRLYLRKKWFARGDRVQRTERAWRYARRLERISGYSTEALLPLAEKAAFSRQGLTEEELGRFDEWYREADRALMEKPWPIQFLLRLIFAIE